MGKQPIKKNSNNKVSQKVIDELKAEDLFIAPIDLADELFIDNVEAYDLIEREKEDIKPIRITVEAPREVTKEDLLKQREEALQKINSLYALQAGKETEIPYYNKETPNRKSKNMDAMGSYNEDFNALTIGDLSRFEDTPMKFDRVLQHEQHHRLFAHAEITDTNGNKVLARQAPMSMSQHYKLEQADEVGSKITEVLTMRQVYVEANSAAERTKQLARTYLAQSNDENSNKLREAIEKGYTITRTEGNKYVIQNGEQKETVDMGNKQCNSVNAYIQKQREFKKLDTEMRNEWVQDKDTGYYWRQVKNGYVKPLSTDRYDMKREMDAIGSGAAQMWQSQYGAEYVSQCTNHTQAYFAEHNFQEIKPNNENYNKALSAALTVGGWDFSGSVKDRLTAPEKIQKIDEMIAKGENEARVIEKAETPLMKNHHTWSDNTEYRIAAEIAGKDKATGVEEKKPELAKWDEQYAQNYKTAMDNMEKIDFPAETKEKIKQMRNELGFDNKKPGDTITKEEITKMQAMYKTIDSYYLDLSDAQKRNSCQCTDALNNIDKKYKNDNVSKQELAQYEKVYNKIKTENDTSSFEYVDKPTVQRYITEIKSGIEHGKSAEEFKIRSMSVNNKTYKDAPLQISRHNKDFSQPFLTDYYKALQNREVEEAKRRVDNVVRNQQEFAAKEQKETEKKTAQTNTTNQQTVAYTNLNQNSR